MSTQTLNTKIYSLKDINPADLKDKKVLVRVDFNVPVDENAQITDDKRLRAALPTINYLKEHGSIVILCSHFGRPKGQKNLKYSLEPVSKALSTLVNQPVTFINDCIGDEVKNKIDNLSAGDVCLLENLRFYAEEENNNPEFAEKLADLADIYVNDAFGAAHRAHASTEGVSHFSKQKYAGFLMEKEVKELGTLLDNPERPFLSIVGGSKISTKLDILYSLIEKSEVVLIGGGMAYTFVKAQGGKIGNSLCEDDKVNEAIKILEFADKKGTAVILPSDYLCGKSLNDKSEKPVSFDSGEIPDGYSGFDIGEKSIANFKYQISLAKTVLWNGPVGVFEDDRYELGSKAVAEALNALHIKGGKTVIGGGDSAAAVVKFGFNDDSFGHISTGGGASLEFLSGLLLPGVACLSK